MSAKRALLLFDVDGTLTPPRLPETPEMKQAIKDMRAAGFAVGTVGGSDFSKQIEQLGATVTSDFDYVFSENGLLAFQDGKQIHKESFLNHLGNEKVVAFVKKALRLVADVEIPVQRGTFIEFRNGMINVSPIGRNCSQTERDEFEVYDNSHHIREKMIEDLKAAFPDYGLQYSIGGQISFDVFPTGWDKTYCLRFVENDFGDIHFFGDKTSKGGNDYEIYNHPRVIGHTVKTFNDTIAELKKLLEQKQ